MKAQAMREDKPMIADTSKQMQDEMVGVLTAISIVSKRLANRLSQLDENQEERGESEHEQKQTCTGCS